MKSCSIQPEGPFLLEESATFGFGQRDAAAFDGTMRLAFCVDGDGYERQVGVIVCQGDTGLVNCEVTGDADVAAVKWQVARVLSLDHDAREFVAMDFIDQVQDIITVGEFYEKAAGGQIIFT